MKIFVFLLLLSIPSFAQATPNGRFQLIQLGQARMDQFMIDTHTGKIWTSVCNGELDGHRCTGPMSWIEMEVEGITKRKSK